MKSSVGDSKPMQTSPEPRARRRSRKRSLNRGRSNGKISFSTKMHRTNPTVRQTDPKDGEIVIHLAKLGIIGERSQHQNHLQWHRKTIRLHTPRQNHPIHQPAARSLPMVEQRKKRAQANLNHHPRNPNPAGKKHHHHANKREVLNFKIHQNTCNMQNILYVCPPFFLF